FNDLESFNLESIQLSVASSCSNHVFLLSLKERPSVALSG
ncbi:MAG: hypothetical protein ACI8W0_001476, partial [Flavobacterium sp.]